MLRAFGKFQLIRPLGRGAMGEVYLAEDPVIGRRVAIKTIRGPEAETQEARDRFLREARAAGVLNHPNLVTIHEFGEVEGTLYLAMEFVEGEDLQRLFETHALTAPELLEVLAQVCEGLAYAHGKGVIHRDIKPSNIRVIREAGRVTAKVMDFGIARLHNSDLTGTGTLLGTFGYMAPEYIQTGKPEARSDLFAVGVILYEALAGRRPFEGDTTATILYRVVHEEPAPLDPAALRGISPRLGEVLRRALAKEPWARFQDGHAMAQALREAKDPGWGGPLWEGIPGSEPTRPAARTVVALAEVPPTTREVPLTEALPRRPLPAPAPATPGRGGRVATLLLLLVALGAGGTWWATHRRAAGVKTISLPEVPHEVAPAQAAPAPAPASSPAPPPAAPHAEPKASKPAPKAEPPLTAEEAEAWLNDAAFGLVNTPQESLKLIDRVVKDHPALPRARALQVAALYHAGRYAEMPKALQAAKDAGLELRQFAFYGAIQTMLRTERQEKRVPAEVREELTELFPRAEERPGRRFTRPFNRGN
jgi:serine/threonine-protein kinase